MTTAATTAYPLASGERAFKVLRIDPDGIRYLWRGRVSLPEARRQQAYLSAIGSRSTREPAHRETGQP